MINCGSAPVVLGQFIDALPPEMMFYLYLPVKMSGSDEVKVPKRLARYHQLLEKVMDDCAELQNKYIYITAKTMFVNGSAPGNRPGWHIDGFGSHGDVNYTWANENPTEFAVQEFENIPDDDAKSMVEITNQIKPTCVRTYKNNTLLKLDESVVQ